MHAEDLRLYRGSRRGGESNFRDETHIGGTRYSDTIDFHLARSRKLLVLLPLAWTVSYDEGVCAVQDVEQAAFVRAVRWQPP